MLNANIPVRVIAAEIWRHVSTIYRDIKRNQYTDTGLPDLSGYHAIVARDMYECRLATDRKMVVHPELKAAIEDRSKPDGRRNRSQAGCGSSASPNTLTRLMREAISGPLISALVVCPGVRCDVGMIPYENTDICRRSALFASSSSCMRRIIRLAVCGIQLKRRACCFTVP